MEVAQRDARACLMYYAGRMTYREIAEALGFAHEGRAKRASDRGLKAIQTKGNENLIADVGHGSRRIGSLSAASGTTRRRR